MATLDLNNTNNPSNNIIDMDVLTKFQEELHLIKANEPDQPMGSEFYLPYVKTVWAYYLLYQMDANISTDKDKKIIEFTSKASPFMDYLMYTVRIQDLPRIAVKPEYIGKVEIAWTPSLGNQICPEGCFSSDTIPIHKINTIIMDDDKQLFASNKSNYIEMQNRCHGTVPELEEWSTELPADTLSIIDPWYYTKSAALAYPMMYNRKARLTHRFTFVDDISRLLRIRVRDPTDRNKWNYGGGYHPDILEGPGDGKLSQPQLWGFYGRILPEDRGRILLDFSESNHTSPGPHLPPGASLGPLMSGPTLGHGPHYTIKPKQNLFVYFEDQLCIKDNIERKYGDIAVIPLESSSPCKGITVKAKNVSAARINNHSNYSTDTNNLREGYNPIQSITQQYGAHGDKFTDLHRVFFERIFPMKHCASCPDVPGYNFIPIAWNCADHFTSSGITFHGELKSCLKVRLQPNDPKRSYSSSTNNKNNLLEMIRQNSNTQSLPNRESPIFEVYACLTLIRKIEFSYNEIEKHYSLSKII